LAAASPPDAWKVFDPKILFMILVKNEWKQKTSEINRSPRARLREAYGENG
jgi:hypothetical protein